MLRPTAAGPSRHLDSLDSANTASFSLWKRNLKIHCQHEGGSKGWEIANDAAISLPLAPFASYPDPSDTDPTSGHLIYPRVPPTAPERTAIGANAAAVATFDDAVSAHAQDPAVNALPTGARPTPYNPQVRDLTDRARDDLRADRVIHAASEKQARKDDASLFARILTTLLPTTHTAVTNHPQYATYASLPPGSHNKSLLLYQLLRSLVTSSTAHNKAANAKALFSLAQGPTTSLDTHLAAVTELHATFASDFASTDPAHQGYVALDTMKTLVIYQSVDLSRYQHTLATACGTDPTNLPPPDVLLNALIQWDRSFGAATTHATPKSFLSYSNRSPHGTPDTKRPTDPNYGTKPHPTKPPNSQCPHCFAHHGKYFYHAANACRTNQPATPATRPSPPTPAARPPPTPTRFALLAAEFETLPPGTAKDHVMSLMAEHMFSAAGPPPAYQYDTPPPGPTAPPGIVPFAQTTQPN